MASRSPSAGSNFKGRIREGKPYEGIEIVLSPEILRKDSSVRSFRSLHSPDGRANTLATDGRRRSILTSPDGKSTMMLKELSSWARQIESWSGAHEQKTHVFLPVDNPPEIEPKLWLPRTLTKFYKLVGLMGHRWPARLIASSCLVLMAELTMSLYILYFVEDSRRTEAQTNMRTFTAMASMSVTTCTVVLFWWFSLSTHEYVNLFLPALLAQQKASARLAYRRRLTFSLAFLCSGLIPVWKFVWDSIYYWQTQALAFTITFMALKTSYYLTYAVGMVLLLAFLTMVPMLGAPFEHIAESMTVCSPDQEVLDTKTLTLEYVAALRCLWRFNTSYSRFGASMLIVNLTALLIYVVWAASDAEMIVYMVGCACIYLMLLSALAIPSLDIERCIDSVQWLMPADDPDDADDSDQFTRQSGLKDQGKIRTKLWVQQTISANASPREPDSANTPPANKPSKKDAPALCRLISEHQQEAKEAALARLEHRLKMSAQGVTFYGLCFTRRLVLTSSWNLLITGLIVFPILRRAGNTMTAPGGD